MVNAQEWLDNEYPKEKRKDVSSLNISKKNLEGKLDLACFTELKVLNIQNNMITELDIKKCPKLEKLICSENKLVELNLKNNTQLTKLECWKNELTSLDLVGLTQLKQLNCNNNYLTSLDYSSLNSNIFNFLNVRDNNLSKQDLSTFSCFTKLETLQIGNINEKKISQGIYNRFEGSLQPLMNLKRLKHLSINNTDLDSGLEYLPDSIEVFTFSAEKREGAKVEVISNQLKPFSKESIKRDYREKPYTNILKEWRENMQIQKTQFEILPK